MFVKRDGSLKYEFGSHAHVLLGRQFETVTTMRLSKNYYLSFAVCLAFLTLILYKFSSDLYALRKRDASIVAGFFILGLCLDELSKQDLPLGLVRTAKALRWFSLAASVTIFIFYPR